MTSSRIALPLQAVAEREASPQTDAKRAHAPDVKPTSTRGALAFVYGGYAARYLYLLILIPFYGRVLGAVAYGKVLAAMSLFNIVWIVVNYGFSAVGTREVASATDPPTVATTFGRHFKARLVMAVFGILLGGIATGYSPILRADPAFGITATAMGVLAGFNLGWYFQGIQRFRTSILLEVVGFAISLTMILVLVRGPSDGLRVLLSILASSVITLAAAYVIAIREIGARSIRFDGAKALIRRSTPLFVSSGIAVMIMNASTFFLSLFASSAEVGYFGAAERLATVGLSLMQPANQVLVGTVARRLATPGSEAHAYGLMRKALWLMGGFGLAGCVGALVLSPYVIPLILGPKFEHSIRIMLVLAFIYPFAAFNQVVCMYVLIPLNEDKRLAIATLTGAACSLSAMILLAGAGFAGVGVAAARVLGEAVTTAMLLVMLVRQRALLRTLLPSRGIDALSRLKRRLVATPVPGSGGEQ